MWVTNLLSGVILQVAVDGQKSQTNASMTNPAVGHTLHGGDCKGIAQKIASIQVWEL